MFFVIIVNFKLNLLKVNINSRMPHIRQVKLVGRWGMTKSQKPLRHFTQMQKKWQVLLFFHFF